MGKKHIPLAVVAATAIALSSGQSAFAEGTSTTVVSQGNKLKLLGVYNELKDISIDENGVTVTLPDSATVGTNAEKIEVKDPNGTVVELEETLPKIPVNKEVTYKFKTSLSSMVYGEWVIDGVKKYVSAYPDVKEIVFTESGIKVSLPGTYKGTTPSTIQAISPRGDKVTLTAPNEATIKEDGTFTYTIPTNIEDVYGEWNIDGKTYNNKETTAYTGLKVSKITKTGVTINLSKAIGKDDVKSINVFTPEGKKITLDNPNFEGTTKELTYKFTTPLTSFIVGTWRVDSVKYEASLPKIEAFTDLEVVSITPEGIMLKSSAIKPFDDQLSVKNPQGQEIAVKAPSDKIQKDDQSYIIYTFVEKPDTVTTGTWIINTDTKFTVLSEDANKAKVKAARDKIKKAVLTLSTNKNYVKYVLAAKEAVEALTYEQKELFAKETVYNQDKLSDLEKTIEAKYKPVQEFETAVKNLNSTATGFVKSVEAAETKYNALTKEQLSYVAAKIKKQYTAYLNEAAVQKALTFDMSNLEGKANDIIAFNKAYKKLSKTEKEDILLNSAKKQKVTELTDKTLQKNASAALAVQKKFDKLKVQKKNNKNKKLYYVIGQNGNPTETETTTKTAEPVMVPSLSAVTKAQTALTALKKKNKAAYDLVNQDLLDKAKGDSTIKSSIAKGELFNKAVKAPSDITDFVSEFAEAKKAYIALTADEKKYAIDKNALKQYKAYLKIDKVAVMYAKMTAPEQTTKSMKLAYDTSNTVSSITNDVKFSKGKFTIPKGNYEFAFKDGDEAKVAYYKDGKWTVADTLPELTKTIATAQEIYAYAKAFNALKDADEAILTKGDNGAVYKQYVGKENDYRKAAAVERKIVSAAKSKRKATIASAQKAYVALTADQKNLVTNVTELDKLK